MDDAVALGLRENDEMVRRIAELGAQRLDKREAPIQVLLRVHLTAGRPSHDDGIALAGGSFADAR